MNVRIAAISGVAAAIVIAVAVYGLAGTMPPADTPVPTDTTTPADTPVPTDTTTPADTPVPTDTTTPADTPVPTDTTTPADTPVPTDTTTPADTPVPTDTTTPADTPVPTGIEVPVYNPAVGTLINSSTIPRDIADSSNAFAIDFYQTILETEESKNIFFSPASMYVAFSVLYEGARDNTASQIQDTFGFEPDAAVRHNDTAHMMASINRDDPDATLDMANALWLANWFAPYDSYVSIARGMYLADTERVSFTDADDGVKKINDWAANKTHDKIMEVITPDDVDDSTAMAITNAIYFKGTWVTQFPKNDTATDDFWTDSDQSTEVDFMRITDRFDYTRSDGAQVLKMPYKGDRLSMLVILPDERDGLAALEETVSAQQIDSWVRDLRDQEVIVAMPKFEMETGYDLISPLKTLGVTDVFNVALADLCGIAPLAPGGNLYVSKATQNAYVKVDEEGTEAAAVTVIVVARESLPPPPPRFTADHPFLFTIYDEESGMILFMGRMSDPNA